MNNIKQRILSAVCAVIFISAFTLSVSADIPAHVDKKPAKINMVTHPNWSGMSSQSEMCKAIQLGYREGCMLYPQEFTDAAGNNVFIPFYNNYPYYLLYGYDSATTFEKDVDAGYAPGDTRNHAADKDVYYTSVDRWQSGSCCADYIYGVGSIGAVSTLSKEIRPAAGAAIMATAVACGWKFNTEDEQKNFINGYLNYAKDKIGNDLTQLYNLMNDGKVQLTQLGQQLAIQYMAQQAVKDSAYSDDFASYVLKNGEDKCAVSALSLAIGKKYVIDSTTLYQPSYCGGRISFYVGNNLSIKDGNVIDTKTGYACSEAFGEVFDYGASLNIKATLDCTAAGIHVLYKTYDYWITASYPVSIAFKGMNRTGADMHITNTFDYDGAPAHVDEGDSTSVSAQPTSKSTDIPCDSTHTLSVPITTTPDELIDADYTKVADIAKSVDLTQSGDIAGTADPTQPWQQSDTNIDFRPFLAIDLTKVFPFCLPFDIVNAFKLFVANPAAPKWDIKMPYVNKMFTGFDYTVDLSQFETWAVISRWFFYILFCIGLTMVTGKLIKH